MLFKTLAGSVLLPLLAAAAMPPSRLPPEQPMRDAAGNRMEAFAPLTPANARVAAAENSHSAMHCTGDRRWCAQLSRDADADEWSLHVFRDMPQGDTPTPAIAKTALPGSGYNRDSYALRPFAVIEADADHALIGVLSQASTGYSGGGASATQLHLYRVGTGDIVETIALPVKGSALIRACFGEKDHKQRAGACHDDYQFGATLTLDRTVADGRPRLIYTTEAYSFPGPVSRSEDSLARPPLKKKDLIWARHAECSYRRLLTPEPATGTYAPDITLPDCEEYTVP